MKNYIEAGDLISFEDMHLFAFKNPDEPLLRLVDLSNGLEYGSINVQLWLFESAIDDLELPITAELHKKGSYSFYIGDHSDDELIQSSDLVSEE